MTNRKRLLLHIGTHKTGTTTLQSALAKNRDKLAGRGICYPVTDRPPFPNPHKHNNLWKALDAGPEAFATEKAVLLREFYGSGAETLVMSEEHLSCHRLTTLAQMRSFTDQFDIEVICFLRRQDYFIESWWSQRCKSGREGLHIDAFTMSDWMQSRTDYLKLLGFWTGFARVTAIGFEQASQTGLVDRFNAATGLDLLPAPRRRNVSPSMEAVAQFAAMNRCGQTFDWKAIEAKHSGARLRHALGSRLREEILATHAAQNAELARRYGVRFPREMPTEPATPLPIPSLLGIGRHLVAHS